jgi:hypothetical protein
VQKIKGGDTVNISPKQVRRLLLEEHSFSQLGFSMMLTRLKGIYASDPSHEVLEDAAEEINAFLGKFKGIMKNDLAIISELGG